MPEMPFWVLATPAFLLLGFLSFLLFRTRRLLKQRTRELEEARRQEALGTLAGGIAHDFNNILGSILGFGVLLEEDLTAHPETQILATQITQAARRGQKIVSQLMSYSRKNMEDGALSLRQPVSLDAVIHDSLALLAPVLRRSTRVDYKKNTNDVTIVADATQVSQALVNLCVNADHAIGVKTGEITVSLDVFAIEGPLKEKKGNGKVVIANGDPPPGLYARLSVADNGEGMTEETAIRVFEPFFTTKEVGKGTGLGLAAVQGILQSHGGAIVVTTERFKGTTFDLLFPMSGE